MNLTIGQRISTRGEDFIITNSNINYDGTWLIDAEGISELVKGKRFSFDSKIDLTVNQISRFVKELSNYLAQPIQEKWDGKTIKNLIAA